MLDYLKLGRNLYKFSPRVKAKTTTFIYNKNGIDQFKKKSIELEDALCSSFRNVKIPMLELSFKDSKPSIGEIVLRDGKEEISRDNFVLLNKRDVKDFTPEADEYMKKMKFDKNGISAITQQNEQLKKILPEFVKDIKSPILELIIGKKKDFSICKIILKDGNKLVNQGFYSKSNNNQGEKIHFFNDKEIITGFGDVRNSVLKQFERLDKKLLKRLWLLDKRSKMMIKSRYGIDCSPKNISALADEWGLTDSRIRGIIIAAKKKMYDADTYSPAIREDLDNLGHILNDRERYSLYHRGNKTEIEDALYKIRKYWEKLIKF